MKTPTAEVLSALQVLAQPASAVALYWNMPQQWGFAPFSRNTQWVIVLLPAGAKRAAASQPEICRASALRRRPHQGAKGAERRWDEAADPPLDVVA